MVEYYFFASRNIKINDDDDDHHQHRRRQMPLLRRQRRPKWRASTLLVLCLVICIVLGVAANVRWSTKDNHFGSGVSTKELRQSHELPMMEGFAVKPTSMNKKERLHKGVDQHDKGRGTLTLEAYYYDNNFSMFAIPAEKWANTSAFVPTKLKVYVYDTLPAKLTTNVEKCLIDTYTNTVDHVENFKAELGLVNLFRSYPGRTYNAEEAELFVVPYAAVGHCQCHEGYSWNCAQVPNEEMEEMRSRLLFLNETKAPVYLSWSSS
jgi:hypothetical protein